MRDARTVWRFGDCELDEPLLELRREGARLPLQPKPFQVLRYLIHHRGRVVPKDELMEQLWPGVCVCESSLWSALRDIRRALRDCSAGPVIAAQRGRGYRFLPEICVPDGLDGLDAEPILPPRAVQARAPLPLWEPALGDPAAPRSPAPRGAPTLVGREREWDRLGQAWDRGRLGPAQVLLLEGDPGIGRGRLLRELSSRVRADGAIATHARWPQDAPQEALRRLRALCRALAAALAPGGSSALGDDLDALLEALRGSAPTRPALIALEDLHWADRAQLSAVRGLLHAVRSKPVLVVASYCAASLAGDHPLRALRADLACQTGAVELRLGPLSSGEARTLLDALGGTELPARHRVPLLAAAQGHPFALRELTRDALERAQRPVRSVSSETDATPPPLPNSIGCFLEDRLGRLCPDARALLFAAACAPSPFSFEAVRTAAELPIDRALQALDEALLGRALACVPGTDMYDFTHVLVRRFLLQRCSPSRRAHLFARLDGTARGSRRKPTRHGPEPVPPIAHARS